MPGAGPVLTLPSFPADGVGRAEGAAPAEPGDPDSGEPGAISLRPVESISDLHWASGGQKSAEGESGAGGQPGPCPRLGSDLFSPPSAGNGPAPSSSLLRPPPRPVPAGPPVLLPTLRPVPAASPCPCLGPSHPLLLALLGLLALASLVLATLAIYLSGMWRWAGLGGVGGCCGKARLPIPSVSLSCPRSPAEPVGAGAGPVAGEPGGCRAPAAGKQRAALGSPQRQR